MKRKNPVELQLRAILELEKKEAARMKMGGLLLLLPGGRLAR